MAANYATLLTAALLLVAMLESTATAARLGQSFSYVQVETLKGGMERDYGEVIEGDQSCEGFKDEDDCLIKRTLAAHTDYIYTQKHKT